MTASLNLSSLQFETCTEQSLSRTSDLSQSLYSTTDAEGQTWVFSKIKIQNKWIYEADNMNGVYCIYEAVN